MLPSSSMRRVLHWNGTDVPAELRSLPVGRYVLEPVDDAPPLTAAQDAGLAAALAELDEGRAESIDDLRRHLDRTLGR
jgi:hypothetical protein